MIVLLRWIMEFTHHPTYFNLANWSEKQSWTLSLSIEAKLWLFCFRTLSAWYYCHSHLPFLLLFFVTLVSLLFCLSTSVSRQTAGNNINFKRPEFKVHVVYLLPTCMSNLYTRTHSVSHHSYICHVSSFSLTLACIPFSSHHSRKEWKFVMETNLASNCKPQAMW